jgi:hypothetical protein
MRIERGVIADVVKAPATSAEAFVDRLVEQGHLPQGLKAELLPRLKDAFASGDPLQIAVQTSTALTAAGVEIVSNGTFAPRTEGSKEVVAWTAQPEPGPRPVRPADTRRLVSPFVGTDRDSGYPYLSGDTVRAHYGRLLAAGVSPQRIVAVAQGLRALVADEAQREALPAADFVTRVADQMEALAKEWRAPRSGLHVARNLVVTRRDDPPPNSIGGAYTGAAYYREAEARDDLYSFPAVISPGELRGFAAKISEEIDAARRQAAATFETEVTRAGRTVTGDEARRRLPELATRALGVDPAYAEIFARVAVQVAAEWESPPPTAQAPGALPVAPGTMSAEARAEVEKFLNPKG